MWFESLSALDYDAALSAVKRLRGESEWLPSHARFLAVAEEERRKAYGRRSLPRGGPCVLCGDSGMVFHERGNVAYPCRACRPVQYVRWAEGHHMSGHVNGGCVDCATFRGGTPKEVEALSEAYRSRVGQYASGEEQF